MNQLYILYEHAMGYSLFRTREYEEIGIFLPQVQSNILDVSKFRSIVYTVAFQSFKTVREALSNMKCLLEGRSHPDLQLFLENNVPKSQKNKLKIVLGVQDEKLSMDISEKLHMSCSTSGVVFEIIRGIRHHFPKLIKGHKDVTNIMHSQVGLAHGYARAKLNINAKNLDVMITETTATIEQINKDANTLAKRVREWYRYYFPELVKIVPDLQLYIQCIKIIEDRKNMPEDVNEKLQSVIQDPCKVSEILQASTSTMGMDISEEDMANINGFVDRILAMKKREEELKEYLKTKMHQIAPTVSNLVGEAIGSQLIVRAGNLAKLARLPSSTVQVLGAEKALFRSLKSKPKQFHFIPQSSLIGQAGKDLHGKISRCLANKVALASRIDCFGDYKSDDSKANALKQDIENQVKFYKTIKCGSAAEQKKLLAAKRALKRKSRKLRLRLHKTTILDPVCDTNSEMT